MSDLSTANIRQTLNELAVQIEAMFGDEPIRAALEKACKFCGAPADRDIDGMYECGTAWGAGDDDRTEDCLRTELEDLRSKPSAPAKLSNLLEWIKAFDKETYSLYGPCRAYREKQSVLARVVDKVNNMIQQCEAAHG